MTDSQIQTYKVCFGIDIGGTTIKIGMFTTNGDMIFKDEIPTRKEENGRFILDDISAYIDRLILKKNIDRKSIIGIGLGVPGSVRANGVVDKCVNLGWGIVDVDEIMCKKTGFMVKSGNDANMAALGEYWRGGANGYSSLVFITIGTGVGGGIIIDGNPLNGYNGAAAEIGHIPVLYDEPQLCNCGKRGCLEQIASATGIVTQAKRFMQESKEDSSLRQIKELTAKDVFDCAKAGDELALKVVDKVSLYLGRALATAAGFIDPQCFIIGGGVCAAGTFFTDRISRYYRENVFHPSRNTKILPARLGNDAGMYGAAKLILTYAQKNNQI